MKMSNLFGQTLRDFPSDAEVMSHKLLVRAGYIRKLTNGIYNYLPLMQRVLHKVEKITREEMDKAGAQELLMPFVQPEELWQQSEEVITSIAREGIKSYKQLPVNLYQIQSKFRDEIRPRFGLLRGREFIMKDAYSFDADEKGLEISYQIMADAYKRIFERCGLETKMVQSDSGAIGGNVSHEFMVICDNENNAGENDVFYCENCDYAANSNHAISNFPEVKTDGGYANAQVVDTPETHTIEALCEFLNIPSTVILKSILYIAEKKPVLALNRADKEIEELTAKAFNDLTYIFNDLCW